MIGLNRDGPAPPQVQWFFTVFRAIDEEGLMPTLNAGADDRDLALVPEEQGGGWRSTMKTYSGAIANSMRDASARKPHCRISAVG